MLVCTACGASLDFVDEELVSEQAAFIVNIATHVREKINKDVCYTIGASSFLSDHFRSCSFVSGKHVEVTWDGVQFRVKDVSRNGTYIVTVKPNRA